MLQVKTLLHPTDLTEASRNAFDLACQIARDRGARIVALHVVPPPNQHSAEVVIGDPLAGLHELAPDVPIDTRVEKGDPANVILRTAQEVKCDLIVMGTHGRTGLSHRLTGHVADEVAQRAACAVLTMRCPFPEERPLGRGVAERPGATQGR
jgi:nucleotide-binding universal stress UspA family protein